MTAVEVRGCTCICSTEGLQIALSTSRGNPAIATENTREARRYQPEPCSGGTIYFKLVYDFYRLVVI